MEISATVIFFLIILTMILYILFEAYKALDIMEQRIRNLEGKTAMTEHIVREIIVDTINEENEEKTEENKWQGDIGTK